MRGTDTDSSLPFIAGQPEFGQFGGYHPNGAVTLFVDGGVRFLTSTIDATVFEAYCTASEKNASSTLR